MPRRDRRNSDTMEDVGVEIQTGSQLHVTRLELRIVVFRFDVSLENMQNHKIGPIPIQAGPARIGPALFIGISSIFRACYFFKFWLKHFFFKFFYKKTVFLPYYSCKKSIKNWLTFKATPFLSMARSAASMSPSSREDETWTSSKLIGALKREKSIKINFLGYCRFKSPQCRLFELQ